MEVKSILSYLVRTFTLGPLVFRKRVSNYDNSTLSALILNKTIKYVKSEIFKFKPLPSQIVLVNNTQKEVNFLDVGGGAGVHYFEYVNNFPDNNLNWYVIENRELVNICTQSKFLNKIKFYDSIGEIKKFIKFDVVFLNGSIQYFPSPVETLNEILNTQAKYIWFERTLLADSNSSVYLNQYSRLSENGPGNFFEGKNRIVKYPLQIIPRAMFESLMSENYKIVLMEISQKTHRLSLFSQGYSYYKYIWERIETLDKAH